MKNSTFVLIPLVIALLLMHSALVAQPNPRGGPPSQERLELIRLWRLIDELEITQEQSLKLFPVWSKHQRTIRDELESRRIVEEELEKLLERETVPDSELLGKIDALRAFGRRESELTTTFHKQLEDVLSVRQQAQFALFERRFRRDLRGIVKQFRDLDGDSRRNRGGGFRARRRDMVE